MSALLVKYRDSDDTYVAGVAVASLGVGVPHGAEPECRNTARTVAEARHSQFLSGVDDVAALGVCSRLAIHHVESVDRDHEFESAGRQILRNDRVALTGFADEDSIISRLIAGQVVARRILKSDPNESVIHCKGPGFFAKIPSRKHRTGASVIVVKQLVYRERACPGGADEGGGLYAGVPLFAPRSTETRALILKGR
jgi:hypothetical protein